MINILVADDECHVVDYLTQMLESQERDEWNIYRAYNGTEVLELLERVKVDIVLLDIHMPGLSGLEVAERITGCRTGIHVIFLTAYDNFDYIYQAGKMAIDGYLLKTEDDHVILERIEQTIDQIRQENSHLRTELQNQKRQILLEHLWQQEILRELIGNYREKSDAGFPLSAQQKVYAVFLVLQRRGFGERKDNTMDTLLLRLQFFGKLFSGFFQFVLWSQDNGDEIILLQPGQNKDIVPVDCLRGLLQNMVDFYTDNFRDSLHILLYYTALQFGEIRQAYIRALQYDEMLNKAGNTVLTLSRVIGRKELDELEGKRGDHGEIQGGQVSAELLLNLQKGDKGSYFRLLGKMKQDCSRHSSMHHLPSIVAYQTVSLMLIEYIRKNQMEQRLAMTVAVYPLYYLSDFLSWEQAFSYLEKLSEKLFALQSDNVLDRNQMLVRRIREYIKEHCCDPINLSSISGYVNYNESYISRVFKQVTGSGIAEYVNQVRLEKACSLLKETQESIQTIALETGFDSPQYFSNVFRKHRGMSPSEYRNL